MKAREAMAMLGGTAAARRLEADVGKRFAGTRLCVTPCVNEEEPEDNWLNFLFFVKSDDRDGKFWRTYQDALAFVESSVSWKGLKLQRECGGDGDGEVIHSFRVISEGSGF